MPKRIPNTPAPVPTNGKAKHDEADDENAVDGSMFDAAVTRIVRPDGGIRWRVEVSFGATHPTDEGTFEVRTVRTLADAEGVIDSAIESMMGDDE